MHINNPEALKSWLTVILEPLCDADPAALARYVLALLKKEKPLKELQTCMQEQLDVFLGAETQPFVNRLFETIRTESYLAEDAVALAMAANAIAASSATPAVDAKLTAALNSEPPPVVPRECTPPPVEMSVGSGNGGSVTNATPTTTTAPKTKESRTGDISLDISPISSVQSLSGGRNVSPPSAPPAAPQPPLPPPPPTMHHKSPIRSSKDDSRDSRRRNRSRSRDRRDHGGSGREKSLRHYRNKSPPPRRNERRGFAGSRRHRSQSGSRSRSPSPERKKPSRSISPLSLAAEQQSASKKSQRCRDFDEKGYCMRGETCPWDHGVDPVVLEDINNPALLALPARAPMEYNPFAPDMWARGGGPQRAGFPRGANFKGAAPPGAFAFPLQAGGTPLQRELIPVPVMDGGKGAGAGGMEMMQVVQGQQQQQQQPPQMQVKRRFEGEDVPMPPEVSVPVGKRKPPVMNRLGPRMNTQQNCSLELRKIPRGLNAIAHLNNHFSKFGKIVNIQISYDGDPEAAIVTFSTHAEANVAYRSTEAVLNNRFIKVFWHTPNPAAAGTNGAGEAGGAGGKQENPMSIRRNYNPGQYHTNHTAENKAAAEAAASGAAPAATTDTPATTTTAGGVATPVATTAGKSLSLVNNAPTAGAAAATGAAPAPQAARIASQKMRAELARKKQAQVKNAVKIVQDLHKRKNDLLQEYVRQMKSAVELVERVEAGDPQRTQLLTTIKELQSKIEKLKKEIKAEQAQLAVQMHASGAAAGVPVRKTKEQAQKELLDVELDLISQEHDGNDTTAIQRKLKELQKSLHPGGAPRPRAVRPPVPRVAPPGSTSVDRRPTTICVLGFDAEDSDTLLGHFKHFGEITKNQLDKTVPSLIISYATRLNAEQAMQRGRVFKEKPLQITWVITGSSGGVVQPKNENPTPTTPMETAAEPIAAEAEDDRSDDEEERSWRR